MGALKIEGCEGRGDIHRMRPEVLVIVNDPGKALRDPSGRGDLPPDEGLVTSILAKGVLQNVICRRDGARLLVIDGRQRVKAATEANRRLREAGRPEGDLILVPVTIPSGGEESAVDAMVATSIKVEHTPAQKLAYAEALAGRGRSPEEISTHLGVPLATVKIMLSLGSASANVRAAIEAGKISLTAAAPMAKKPAEEQDAQLEQLLKDAPKTGKGSGKVTVRAARGEHKRPTRKQATRVFDALKAKPPKKPESLMAVIEWLLSGQPLPDDLQALLAGAAGPKPTKKGKG